MEARYEHIPQTNMEPVNYYHIDVLYTPQDVDSNSRSLVQVAEQAYPLI